MNRLNVLAALVFTLFISMMLSAQAQTFDVGGLRYSLTGANTVAVGGRASSNTDRDIVIPVTVIDNGTTYSVTTISVLAFSGLNLASVTIPDSVTSIGIEAFADNSLTTVTIPSSVTTIEASAFMQNALTTVTIPSSVATIGNGAFYLNALTGVTIPDSVTSIGNRAFSDNAITSAAFLGDFGTFSLNMFEDNASLTTITYVQGASGWPQTFTPNTGPSGSLTAVTLTPAGTAPVPTLPLFGLGILTSLLGLFGLRKLQQ